MIRLSASAARSGGATTKLVLALGVLLVGCGAATTTQTPTDKSAMIASYITANLVSYSGPIEMQGLVVPAGDTAATAATVQPGMTCHEKGDAQTYSCIGTATLGDSTGTIELQLSIDAYASNGNVFTYDVTRAAMVAG